MWLWLLYTILITAPLYFLYKFKLNSTKKCIANKHVLITGGSSGIGKALAILAAEKGAHVTILARNLKKLNEALEEIKKVAVSTTQLIQGFSCDVSNFDNVQSVINEIEDTVGPVYMLVNCAGLALCGVLEDMSISDIKTLVDVNLLGTLYPTKALVSKMKSRKSGVVVFTSSQGGLLGIYGYPVYASTKFAIRGLAEALNMELKPYNISVTISLPPDTDTPGFENENKSKPVETQLISESGGLFKPETVAEALLNDALNGKFYSFVGFESFILSTLCVGMTPAFDCLELLGQVLLLGPLRLISHFVLANFHNVISKSLKGKNKL